MLLSTFIRESSRALLELYPEREAGEIVLRLCEDLLGTGRVEHILNPERELPPSRLPELESAFSRLLAGEPLQYVLGYADFCSRRFKVNPSVLIPRPETEDLVRMALSCVGSGSRVLDLCTGSGCIAWTVALECPQARVFAVDISSEALETAAGQFEGPGPDFICADILKPLDLPQCSFDVIISNPPYVMDREKSSMRRNVLEYEPGLALFVPDGDPLLFYRAIAVRARELLKPSGKAFLEINETLGPQTLSIFREEGMADCGISEDFAGKQRYLHFQKT